MVHLLILGATGRTGVFAYKYALEQGYHVTVLVRTASALESHPNLTIVEGSILSEDDMDRAFTAAGKPIDAVIQVANARRASDNPWAAFIGPPRLLADSTANATRALRKQPKGAQNPRLIQLNALGVRESWGVTPYIFRFMISYSNIGNTYEDHEAVNAEIEENAGKEVDWTIVFAPGLGDAGDKEVKVFDPAEGGQSMFITRESCARWMVDVAGGKFGDQFCYKRVIVSN